MRFLAYSLAAAAMILVPLSQGVAEPVRMAGAGQDQTDDAKAAEPAQDVEDTGADKKTFKKKDQKKGTGKRDDDKKGDFKKGDFKKDDAKKGDFKKDDFKKDDAKKGDFKKGDFKKGPSKDAGGKTPIPRKTQVDRDDDDKKKFIQKQDTSKPTPKPEFKAEEKKAPSATISPGLTKPQSGSEPDSQMAPGLMKKKSAAKPPPTPEQKKKKAEADRNRFETLKKGRRETKEDGGKRVVIVESDKRTIIREGGKSIIRHDENDRFRKHYSRSRTERTSTGTTILIAFGSGGIEIRTEVDRDGRQLRRWRRDRYGRETVMFDNRAYYNRFGGRSPTFLDAIVALSPLIVGIPRERYIVEYDRASDDDLYETLRAPPIEALDRGYSLEEVRYSQSLRDRMRRLDLDTIEFDFGSWDIDPSDYGRLERLARVMARLIEDNPDETFLIEGHTDAVGSDEDNLTLSDRRAETVAIILTDEFGIPPENLVTQGYGEQFLKIDTLAPERLNRRVAVRKVTPLLAR